MGAHHLSLSPFEEEKWSFTFYYLEEQEVNFCSATKAKSDQQLWEFSVFSDT